MENDISLQGWIWKNFYKHYATVAEELAGIQEIAAKVRSIGRQWKLLVTSIPPNPRFVPKEIRDNYGEFVKGMNEI
jgi:hypothetical protein